MSKKNLMVLILVLALTVSTFASIPMKLKGTIGAETKFTPEKGLESKMTYKINYDMNIDAGGLYLVWSSYLRTENTKFMHDVSSKADFELKAPSHAYSKLTIKGKYFTNGQTVTTTIGPFKLDWGTHYVYRNEANWDNASASSIYGWKLEGLKVGSMAVEAFYGYDNGSDHAAVDGIKRPIFGTKVAGDIVKGSNLDIALVTGLKETKKVDRPYDEKQNVAFAGKSTNMARAIFNQTLNNIGTLKLEGAVIVNTNDVPKKDDPAKTSIQVVGTKPYVARLSTTIDKLIPNVSLTLNASDVHAYFAPEWRAMHITYGRNYYLLGDRGQLKYGVVASTNVAGVDLGAGYDWTGDKVDNFWKTEEDAEKMNFDFLKTTDTIKANAGYTVEGVKLALDGSYSISESVDGTRKRVTGNKFNTPNNDDPDLIFWNIENQKFEKGRSTAVRANASATTKLYKADATAKYSFIWDKANGDILPIWHKAELNYTGYQVKVPGLADNLTVNYNSDYWFAADKRVNQVLADSDTQKNSNFYFSTWQRVGLATKVDVLGAKGINFGAGINFDNRFGNKLEGRSATIDNIAGRWRDKANPWYYDVSASYQAPNGISFAAKYSWPDHYLEGTDKAADTYVTVNYSVSF